MTTFNRSKRWLTSLIFLISSIIFTTSHAVTLTFHLREVGGKASDTQKTPNKRNIRFQIEANPTDTLETLKIKFSKGEYEIISGEKKNNEPKINIKRLTVYLTSQQRLHKREHGKAIAFKKCDYKKTLTELGITETTELELNENKVRGLFEGQLVVLINKKHKVLIPYDETSTVQDIIDTLALAFKNEYKQIAPQSPFKLHFDAKELDPRNLIVDQLTTPVAPNEKYIFSLDPSIPTTTIDEIRATMAIAEGNFCNLYDHYSGILSLYKKPEGTTYNQITTLLTRALAAKIDKSDIPQPLATHFGTIIKNLGTISAAVKEEEQRFPTTPAAIPAPPAKKDAPESSVAEPATEPVAPPSPTPVAPSTPQKELNPQPIAPVTPAPTAPSFQQTPLSSKVKGMLQKMSAEQNKPLKITDDNLDASATAGNDSKSPDTPSDYSVDTTGDDEDETAIPSDDDVAAGEDEEPVTSPSTARSALPPASPTATEQPPTDELTPLPPSTAQSTAAPSTPVKLPLTTSAATAFGSPTKPSPLKPPVSPPKIESITPPASSDAKDSPAIPAPGNTGDQKPNDAGTKPPLKTDTDVNTSTISSDSSNLIPVAIAGTAALVTAGLLIKYRQQILNWFNNPEALDAEALQKEVRHMFHIGVICSSVDEFQQYLDETLATHTPDDQAKILAYLTNAEYADSVTRSYSEHERKKIKAYLGTLNDKQSTITAGQAA